MSVFFGYYKLQVKPGETVKIVSASVDNTYVLYGFKETEFTKKGKVDIVDIFVIESTILKPQYDKFPKGYRDYRINSWQDVGADE
jgi:hypothetical protein